MAAFLPEHMEPHVPSMSTAFVFLGTQKTDAMRLRVMETEKKNKDNLRWRWAGKGISGLPYSMSRVSDGILVGLSGIS